MRIHLAAGDASAIVDLAAGGRLASLTIAGHEVLGGIGTGPIEWGCYPMAPWAGRIRGGHFTFAGGEYRLPPNLGGHALHGTVFTTPWRVLDEGRYAAELAPPWPWPGRVVQDVDLAPDRLRLRLEVHATRDPMPASCGWHPWFRRSIGGRRAVLSLDAGYLLRRDRDGIATTERVSPPPPGPWDDCFGDVSWPVTVSWPGRLQLAVTAGTDYVVVYDERAEALCVEPQTHPPGALNRDPAVVVPGEPLVVESEWAWRTDPAGRRER